LQSMDRLHGVQTHRPIGTAVKCGMAVTVALHTAGGHARLGHGRLRHASRRHADLHDARAHNRTSTPTPLAMARLYASLAVARSSSAKPTDLNSVTSAAAVRPGRLPVISSASSATTWPRSIACSVI